MRSVVFLLTLLIALFVTGMLLLSHLNLSHSQQALSELRRHQIKDAFFTNLTRIDARQAALERRTATLALIGETFYRLSSNTQADSLTQQKLKKELENAISTHLREFSGASGAGLWFEPGVLAPSGQAWSPYFSVTGNALLPQTIEKSGNYREEPWFDRALGPAWTAKEHPEGKVYWSSAYFEFTTDRALLTLVSPMFSSDGKLIGMATTDWASDQIIDLVSRAEVTANSFSFLNDRNNRNLSSLSRSDDPVLEQKIIDALLSQQLHTEMMDASVAINPGTIQPERLRKRVMGVEGRFYELYYAVTPAGMIYGTGVPRNEINQVLVPMRDTNYRILITTGAVLLILSLYFIYRILQLVRELQASYTDRLTGLPNRARLLKDLEKLNSPKGDCLVIINLDRFREINSLFGSACGDTVLQALARQLQRFIGDSGKIFDARLYRLSGDEFALLGPAIPEPVARALASDLSSFIRNQQICWQEQQLSVDATTGIAFWKNDGEQTLPDGLLTHATIALRQAREQMRNYQIYDAGDQIERIYERNLYWARRLKNALDKDQIIPHFQPIHDNQIMRVTKYECLARMAGPDGEIISAGGFLGIAGKLRLDRQITRIMIEKSFARFRDEACDFSVNLSYADLVEPEILQLILAQLKSRDIGNRVIFEILESDGIRNYSEVLHFIDQVKQFGCQIAIDDFGTGYSNFEHLLRLNVDIIKIDGSLIRHLHEDHTAFAVTRGIVEFARGLGISTVAEFVHSEEVQAKVVELGIDFSQGELFQMPGPDMVSDESAFPRPNSEAGQARRRTAKSRQA
ncbi:EAL domain-containing protein [Marinobacter sp.]|uniref:bifunctional diguanylate cyclase/phosphodiesterase n=1 Tax=Marinobacter sp. TaxID=50741 RepID=UPI00384B6955